MVTPTPNSLHRVPYSVHGVVNSVNSKRAVIDISVKFSSLWSFQVNQTSLREFDNIFGIENHPRHLQNDPGPY